MIRQLEDELGCKLFVRGARGSVLTPSGQYLAEQFAPLVRCFRRLEKEAMIHLAKQTRTISLVSAPLLFGVLDTNVLFAYREEHPQTELNIDVIPDVEIERYIQEESTHFGLIAAPEGYLKNHYEYRTIHTYPIVLIVNKDNPLSKRDSVSFRDLQGERFLSLDRRSLYRTATIDKAAEYGFQPQIVFESPDVHELCKLADSGKGIVVGTESPSFGTLYPNIRTIPFQEEDMRVCISFVFQDFRQLEPEAKGFIEYITHRETEGGRKTAGQSSASFSDS